MGDEARSKDGNGLAIAVIAALALVALAALAVAGYFIVQWVVVASTSVTDPNQGDTDHFVTPDNEGFEAAAEFPPELQDLDALTATPGDTFVGGFDLMRVGEDIVPGLYIAPDAEPASAADGRYCYWSVSREEQYSEGGYYAQGKVEGGTAMMLAPAGYWVRASESCGTWQAIDPDTAFEGAESKGAAGTVMGSENNVVGRDVVPGTYLSAARVPQGADCMVTVTDHFGFQGPHNYGDALFGLGGTLQLTVEPGDVVNVWGCPDFELTDLETAYMADAGAKSIDVGTWLVGIDVAPGAYLGPVGHETGEEYCALYVWDGPRDWGVGGPTEEVFYHAGEEPMTVSLEAGQTVEVMDCPGWELVSP